MKNRYVFVFKSLLLFGVVNNSYGQFLADNSAEGVSSLIGGTSVGFDLTKTSIRFDYTSKLQGRNYDPNNPSKGYTNWGATLLGGNSNNIAQLVANGSFVPSTSASGFIFRGWNISQNQISNLQKPLPGIATEIAKKDNAFLGSIKTSGIDLRIHKLTSTVQTDVNKTFPTNQADFIPVITVADLTKIKEKDGTSASDKAIIDDLIKFINDELDKLHNSPAYVELVNQQNSIQQQIADYQRLNPYKRVLIYGRLGTKATKLKFYQTLNAQNISQSFTDTLFTGIFSEIGVNYFTTSYLMFGLNVGYTRANTLQNAQSNSFTIEKVTTSADGQKATSKQDVTAYQGNYQQYGQVSVKGDMVVLLPASQKGTFAINPFFRFASGADKAVADQLRLGINGYFFNQKGKFLGGLYVERSYSIEVTSRASNTTSFSVTRKGLEFGIRAAYLLDTFLNVAKPNGN